MRALMLLAVLASASCASSGAAPTPMPFPRPRGAPAPPVPTPAGPVTVSGAGGLTRTALSLRGTPYRFGGADPSGFDCSGFVQYVFEQHSVFLPRQVVDLYQVGTPLGPTEVEPGDLLFFSTIAPGASHVGLALGQKEFIHAPSERGNVRVERLDSSYWSERFIGARRVLAAGPPTC